MPTGRLSFSLERAVGREKTAGDAGEVYEPVDDAKTEVWKNDARRRYVNKSSFPNRFYGNDCDEISDCELFAMNVVRFLECRNTWDLENESNFAALVRTLASGFRIAVPITHIAVVVAALQMEIAREYGLYRTDADGPANAIAVIVFLLWCVHILLGSYAFLSQRIHTADTYGRGDRYFWYRDVTEKKKTALQRRLDELYIFVIFLFYAVLAVFAKIATFIVMSHMLNRRIVYLSVLFGLFTFYALVCVLEDATRIGRPLGVQEDSKTASRALGIRFCLFIFVLFFSIAYIIVVHPPSECVEC